MESIDSPYRLNNDSLSPQTPGSTSVLRKLERIPNCTIEESTRHTNDVLQNEAWSFCTGDDEDEITSTSVDELETANGSTPSPHYAVSSFSSLSADASPSGGRMNEDFSPRLARSEDLTTGGRTPSSNKKRSHGHPRETRRISLCVGDSSDEDSLSDEADSTTPNETRPIHVGGKSRGRHRTGSGIQTMYESAFDLDWSRGDYHSGEYDDAAVDRGTVRESSPLVKEKVTDVVDPPAMVTNALELPFECTEGIPQVENVAAHRTALALQKEAFLSITVFVLIMLLVCIVMVLVYQMGLRHGLEYAKRCHIELEGLLSRTISGEL
ncbi:hypothetical protein FOL47_003300 [Perkinsus chesapeaki]|uniref:Uncharacterized protein n=1 Tax=Perkinsus chesapeaki TaxID=330153 RepID=A0A7J6N2U6_PERCH|nr:hypothetical protein FOL47_003300 [Perkinsus chesapeaki]